MKNICTRPTDELPKNFKVEHFRPDGFQDGPYKIALSEDIHEIGEEILVNHGFEVERVAKDADPRTVRSVLEKVDGFGFRTEHHDLLAKHKSILKDTRCGVLMRAGIGFKRELANAAAREGKVMMRTPEANRESVFRFTIWASEHLLNQFSEMNRTMKIQNSWSSAKKAWSLEALENPLKGKTVFVLGVGGIGGRVARELQRRGARVLYNDIRDIDIDGCESVALEKGLQEADLVTVHVDGEDEVLHDHHLRMIRGYLINTARGKVINSEALLDCLKGGSVLGAALDVHRKEGEELFEDPVCKELVNHPGVFSTPHNLGREVNAEKTNAEDAAYKLIGFERGGAIKDGCNAPEMPQLQGLFGRGNNTVTVGIYNADVHSVHFNTSKAVREALGDSPNKGADHTERHFDTELYVNDGRRINPAYRLVELDLNGTDPELLLKIVQVIKKVEGVLRVDLRRFSRKA